MGETKPLTEILESRLGFLLNEVLKLLRQQLDEGVKEIGISSRHLGILLVLDQQGPQTQKEIAQTLRIDRTTMGLLTSELEKLKLVNRATHPDDKRCNRVTLTVSGVRAAGEGLSAATHVQEKFLGPISPTDWSELKRILTLLYRAHFAEETDG